MISRTFFSTISWRLAISLTLLATLITGTQAFGALRCDQAQSGASFGLEIVSFNPRQKLSKQNEIRADNPVWQKGLFPGQVSETAYAKLYVNNMSIAGRYFIGEFLRSDFKTYNSYVDILFQQHRLAVLGVDPQKPYTGETSLSQAVDYLVTTINAEKKRAQIALLTDAKKFAGKLRPDDGLTLTVEIGGYISDSHTEERGQQVLSMFEKKIQIPGIPDEALPVNDFAKYVWNHYYPSPAHFTLYLKAMHRVMFKIRNCENCTQVQVLELLADYYHIGVNAHLFKKVNHSLLMVQINGILLQMGLSPISHLAGPPLDMRIDLVALMLSTENFRPVFMNEILKQRK